MALAEHDDVVETLTADRSYQALDVGVLPRRAQGAHDLFDVHACEPVAEGRAVDAIAIPHEVLRCAVIWERFDDLLRSPSSGRVGGDVEVQTRGRSCANTTKTTSTRKVAVGTVKKSIEASVPT